MPEILEPVMSLSEEINWILVEFVFMISRSIYNDHEPADQLIFKTQADKKSWAKPDAYEMYAGFLHSFL